MRAAQPRLYIIWLTVFIDLVGFGIIIPILPYFAQHWVGWVASLGVPKAKGTGAA